MADSWMAKQSQARRLQNQQHPQRVASVGGRVRQAAPVKRRIQLETPDFNMHVGDTAPEDIYLGRAWLDISDSPGTSITELPAHNVTLMGGPGSDIGCVLVGDAECLATRGTDSYVEITQSTANPEPSFRIGFTDDTGDGGTEVTGFGLFELPEGSVVTEVRFIAEGFTDGSIPVVEADFESDLGPIGPGGGSDYTNPPVVNRPLLLIRYGGDPWFFGGYNISTFPEFVNGPAECAVDEIVHLIGGADYVFAGIGTPDTGDHGILAGIYMPYHPWPDTGNHTITLTYLAIRITYTSSSLGRLKVWTTSGWEYA